jgi:kynureninase
MNFARTAMLIGQRLPRRRPHWLAVPLLLIANTGSAQVLYGSFTGTVTDASSSAIIGAKIEAVNINTGTTKDTVSDDHGGYLFTNLQPGTYKVTVTAASFGTFVQQGLQIEANAEKRVDAQLQPAAVQQTVTVEASVVAVQTDRADVNQQLQSSQITQLPEDRRPGISRPSS